MNFLKAMIVGCALVAVGLAASQPAGAQGLPDQKAGLQQNLWVASGSGS